MIWMIPKNVYVWSKNLKNVILLTNKYENMREWGIIVFFVFDKILII